MAVPVFAERLTRAQWAGLVLGLLGVGISVSDRLSGDARSSGYAFTGLALAGLAAGTLYQKRFNLSTDLRTGTTIQLLGAAVTCFPLAAAYGGLDIPLTAGALGSLAWLAVVNSIGALVLLFVLLRRSSGGAGVLLVLTQQNGAPARGIQVRRSERGVRSVRSGSTRRPRVPSRSTRRPRCPS
ncbi:hypothetical protein [Spirillospora sp. NPDC047279]|uniref:hypothetical protein n=1 Tax=Spirillospora sp. NPDC047279 TaxID=3155478 RepID=UPI0033CB270C